MSLKYLSHKSLGYCFFVTVGECYSHCFGTKLGDSHDRLRSFMSFLSRASSSYKKKNGVIGLGVRIQLFHFICKVEARIRVPDDALLLNNIFSSLFFALLPRIERRY
jgi:hypothetical protein